MEIFFEKSYMTFHNVFTAFYIHEVHNNGIVLCHDIRYLADMAKAETFWCVDRLVHGRFEILG